jgi:hypothetical protein
MALGFDLLCLTCLQPYYKVTDGIASTNRLFYLDCYLPLSHFGKDRFHHAL